MCFFNFFVSTLFLHDSRNGQLLLMSHVPSEYDDQFQVLQNDSCVGSHGTSARIRSTQSLERYLIPMLSRNTKYVARSYIISGIDNTSVIVFSVENICVCFVSMFWAQVYLMFITVFILVLSPTILWHASMVNSLTKWFATFRCIFR